MNGEDTNLTGDVGTGSRMLPYGLASYLPLWLGYFTWKMEFTLVAVTTS